MKVGLVLGAGGVLGGAWATGGLAALADETGWDPGSADYIVGTSAGSVIAALIAAGVPPWFMVAHSAGESFDGLVDAAYARFGRVDVLINNAGKSPTYPTVADVNEQEPANDAGARGRVQRRRAAGDPAPLAGQAGEVRRLWADIDRRDQTAIARDRASGIEWGRPGERARGILRARLSDQDRACDDDRRQNTDAATSPCDA